MHSELSENEIDDEGEVQLPISFAVALSLMFIGFGILGYALGYKQHALMTQWVWDNSPSPGSEAGKNLGRYPKSKDAKGEKDSG